MRQPGGKHLDALCDRGRATGFEGHLLSSRPFTLILTAGNDYTKAMPGPSEKNEV